jgi:hypothetical protein
MAGGLNRVLLIGRAGKDVEMPTSPVRFWSKVERRGECWVWTGSKDAHGYGRISSTRGKSPRRVHRVAYELTYGSIPDGAVICHDCDNPSCVRPSHLRAGTQKQNICDARDRGRLGEPIRTEDNRRFAGRRKAA